MIPRERPIEKRELAADVYMPVAFRTIWLLLLLVIWYFIAGPGRIVPLVQPLLAPLFLPVAAGAIAWYFRSLIPVVFAGRLVDTLRIAFTVLAVVLFLGILASSSSYTSGFALPVLLAGSAFVLYLVGSAYSDAGRVLTRTLLLGAVGLCPILLASASGSAAAVALGWMALVGFGAAAALSLGSLLREHDNKYVAYAGNVTGRGGFMTLVGLVIFLVLVYDQFLRPGLESWFGGRLMIAEWLVLLTALALAGFLIWIMARSISGEREFGDLETLVQQISYDRKQLEMASAAVDGFVEQGRKEALIVYLTRVMLDNGAPPKAIEGIISGIVGCQDDPVPPLVLRWTMGDIAGRNRDRRLAAVTEAVAAGAALAKQGPIVSKETAAPEEDFLITT